MVKEKGEKEVDSFSPAAYGAQAHYVRVDREIKMSHFEGLP
jgi:hypothetical protein